MVPASYELHTLTYIHLHKLSAQIIMAIQPFSAHTPFSTLMHVLIIPSL